jgi:hypothetical protein
MGTCKSFESPTEGRDPKGNGAARGAAEGGLLVRFRFRLQDRVVRGLILRRRAQLTSFESGIGIPQWLARHMRIRIPARSFRAAGVVVTAAAILGPITLTLVGARHVSVDRVLAKIERLGLSGGEAALPVSAPAIPSRQTSETARLTAGNIPAGNSSGFAGSLNNAANEFSGSRTASLTGADAAPQADSSLAQNSPGESSAGSKRGANSSGWPLAPARNRLDPRLRDGYMWRAWMEKAAEFHAQRVHGQSLLLYHPGEGYAVLRAAYQPMIQPVKPREDSEPQDRSVYQDRRDPREAPGTLPAEPDPNARPAGKSGRSGSGKLSGLGAGNSFQPWDSDALTNPFGPANSVVSRVPGLRIERVVLFQGISSNGYPMEAGIPRFNQNLGYDVDLGATATISWTRARRTSSLFMVYTPSHFQRLRYSEWNSTNHELGLGVSKSFRRWGVTARANSGIRGLPQVLFTPAVLRPVPNAPGSFDDLLQAAEGGQLSSDEIASVLTGTPVVEAQPKTRFDNGQVLSSSLSAGASYAATPRLSTNFGVSASHYQALSTPQSDDNVVGLLGVNRALSYGANAGMDYLLSPDLSVGVTSNVRRNDSSYHEASSVNTSGTVTKRVGRNWSVNGGAGVGTVTGIDARSKSLGTLPRTHSSWIVNGGLNYSGREHRIGVSGARALGDSVGLGAQVSYTAGAQWQWNRVGTPWGLYGNANWYKMSLQGFRDTQGTFLGGGLMRQLSRETSFQAEYSYQQFNSPYRGVVSNLSGHRLQMSWMWRPAGAPR